MKPAAISPQHGAALIVSMVLLVAITLVGVFAMSGSHLEWLMASNSRFQTDAGMRAEAALSDGEQSVPSNPNTFAWTDNDAYYSSDPAMLDQITGDPHNINDWNNSTFNSVSATTLTAPGTTNRFLVEYMGCSYTGVGNCTNPCNTPTAADKCIYIYRIWAHATDSKGANRIAQSTYEVTVSSTSTQKSRIAFAEIDHDQAPNP